MRFDNLDRYKKFEYAITGDVDAPDHGYHYSDEINELLHKTYLRVQKQKPHLIPELLKLVEKYPRVPVFKNYLSMYYNLSRKASKAHEVNHWLVKEHPDYLHGKINLAAEAISKRNYDEVPKILGEALDLKDLYPNRKVFHISEFQAFFSITCQYLIETDQLEAAESRIELAAEVLSHDPKATEGFRMQILAKRVSNRKEAEADWHKKHGEEIGRSYDKSIQTDEKPNFHHPEIWELYKHGLRIPEAVLHNILSLPRETLLQDLETVVWDAVRRYEYFGEMLDEWDEWREEELSFPLHALFLLTELRATEKLPLILDLLRQGQELLDFWFDDHVFETVWHYIYHLGGGQLDLLKSFMQEPDICSEGKTIVSQAVVQLAFHHPERHGEIVDWYKGLLQYYLDNLKAPKLVDVDVLAPIICDLSNLRAADALPLCKPFFDLDLVDLSYAGDYKGIEEETLKPPSEHDKLTVYPNIFEHLKHILNEWHGYLSPEEQARRDAHFKQKMAEVDLEKLGKKPAPLATPIADSPWPETIKKEGPKVGRNDPCPCGSGKKYKKCCMK